MAILLLLQLLSQEMVQLEAIPPGNQVPNGSFQITVPENCLYVGEEHVPLVYQTMGITSIPNCVGIFISESRGYAVFVQHYPYQAFKLEPVIDDHEFNTLFQFTHLYTNSPYAGESETFIPPTIDELSSSFTFGMHYYNTETKAGYFAKKIWTTDQDALVLTLSSSEEEYQLHETEIQSILQAVTKNENAERQESMGEAISYLELMGMYLKGKEQPVNAASVENQGLSVSVILTSIGLAVGAILLLVTAALIQKKSKRIAASDPNDAQA